MDFTTIELQPRKVAVSSFVDRHLKASIGDDVMWDRLRYQLESYVMANQLESQTAMHRERVPATWWDAFKLSAIGDGNPFFDPEKVKYRNIELHTEYRVWATFPECEIEFPDTLGRPRIVIESNRIDDPRLISR